MTAPGTIGCAVWVDGAWVADGSGPDDDEPVALAGLSITWGRSTTVDQIEPSTAQFELLDPPGSTSFMDLLYVGAAVDVTAAGDVPAPSTLPINTDPGFEAAALGSVPDWKYVAPSTAVVVGDRAATGAQSVKLYWVPRAGDPVAGASAKIPPAPFTPGNPAGWDDIPQMHTGEFWAASANVQTPVGGWVQMQLVAWTTPDPQGSGGLGNGFGPYRTAVDTDPTSIGWQPFAIPASAIPADKDGQWIGLSVAANPAHWEHIYPSVDGASNPVAWADAAGTWDEWNAGYLDDVQLLAPASAGTVHRDVTVFSGRVTDLDAGYDTAAGGVVCHVTASDFTADLAQRDVGAEPWPAEPLATRFARVLAAAGVDVRYTIAPTLGAFVVSWLDVDRQQAWPLLADLATSVDGVLWSATHHLTGPYLWLADPRTQSALYVLGVDPDTGLVIIEATPAAGSAIELDACDVLLDPVTFRQSVSDLSTRVAVTWKEQTVDDDGLPAPTDRTDTVIDTAAELAHGTRRVAVSSLLTTAVDAELVAAQILGRLRLTSWRVGGLNWTTALSEMDGDRTTRALDLLDGTRRLGVAILLTNLPDWVPSGADTLPLLLQGGTYSFDAGQWELDLTTSSAAAQGTSLAWVDLDPGWSWTEFDPAIAWTDLAGVGR